MLGVSKLGNCRLCIHDSFGFWDGRKKKKNTVVFFWYPNIQSLPYRGVQSPARSFHPCTARSTLLFGGNERISGPFGPIGCHLRRDVCWPIQDGAPQWCERWFINPMNTIVISTINHRFNGSYWHQLSDSELGHHLVVGKVFETKSLQDFGYSIAPLLEEVAEKDSTLPLLGSENMDDVEQLVFRCLDMWQNAALLDLLPSFQRPSKASRLSLDDFKTHWHHVTPLFFPLWRSDTCQVDTPQISWWPWSLKRW